MASKISASSKGFPKGALCGSQESTAAPRYPCLPLENHGGPQLCAEPLGPFCLPLPGGVTTFAEPLTHITQGQSRSTGPRRERRWTPAESGCAPPATPCAPRQTPLRAPPCSPRRGRGSRPVRSALPRVAPPRPSWARGRACAPRRAGKVRSPCRAPLVRPAAAVWPPEAPCAPAPAPQRLCLPHLPRKGSPGGARALGGCRELLPQ